MVECILCVHDVLIYGNSLFKCISRSTVLCLLDSVLRLSGIGLLMVANPPSPAPHWLFSLRSGRDCGYS